MWGCFSVYSFNWVPGQCTSPAFGCSGHPLEASSQIPENKNLVQLFLISVLRGMFPISQVLFEFPTLSFLPWQELLFIIVSLLNLHPYLKGSFLSSGTVYHIIYHPWVPSLSQWISWSTRLTRILLSWFFCSIKFCPFSIPQKYPFQALDFTS